MNSITLTPDQLSARDKILKWYDQNKNEYSVLTLGGYAGTGKTTLLSSIREALGDDIAVGFISFTGKAVSVMRRKLKNGFLLNDDTISTIHSFMYRPILQAGKVIDWEWKPMNKPGCFSVHEAPYVDLFIMDEASMTPKTLMDDLSDYNKPILAVGDHGQLPPVKSNFSLMQSPEIRLETILRQAQDSPILTLAHQAREGKFIDIGTYSDNVKKIKGSQFSGSDVEQIVARADSSVMTIVPTNKMRVDFNKRIRNHTVGLIKDSPVVGDRVICLRNNNREGLYNGMTGTIDKVLDFCERPAEYNMGLSIVSDEGSHHNVDVLKCLFHNPKGDVPDNIPYRDRGNSFDYAYSITCHKSQGSEAPAVVVIGSGFGDREMRRRWLYTAITRAQEELYLVDISDTSASAGGTRS